MVAPSLPAFPCLPRSSSELSCVRPWVGCAASGVMPARLIGTGRETVWASLEARNRSAAVGGMGWSAGGASVLRWTGC